jgi:hypothetical protein
MPKWLQDILMAIQIFASLLPIITAAAATFGANSTEAQELVTSIITDPDIPTPAQKRVTNYAQIHLKLLARVATNNKTAPVVNGGAPLPA